MSDGPADQQPPPTNHRPEAIIVDMDGTLADVSGIRHYVSGDRRRWNFDRFHAASAFVPAHQDVVDLVRRHHDEGRAIIVVTARKERWRYLTATWLQKWDVPVDALLMRRDSDGRPDVEVKRDLLVRIRARYDVVLAIDDNPAVIALWRSKRIPVHVVPGWDAQHG